MPFGNIQELKRAYSTNFDSFFSLFEKALESRSDLQDNSTEIIKTLSSLAEEAVSFQNIFEKNPELKVANIINANMAAKEMFELDKETSCNYGLISRITKLIEKLNKTETELLDEKNSKAKKELEESCNEIIKQITETKTQLRAKTNDFLKFLETSGNLEIKNK